MKKFLIIISLFVSAIIIFGIAEYQQKNNIRMMSKVTGLNIEENHVSFTLGDSWHLKSWNYDYILENRTLYIIAYNLSFFNPMALHYDFIPVSLDLGYDDFDFIYLNGTGEDKVLVWSNEKMN